jgi:hypothetical protein
MNRRDEIESRCLAAGLEESDGLWRDGNEVAAAVSDAGVFVGWLDVTWAGPATPTWQLRNVVHIAPGEVEGGLAKALDRARSRRRSSLRKCSYCQQSFIPGHMYEKDVCQGCASTHLGVDF